MKSEKEERNIYYFSPTITKIFTSGFSKKNEKILIIFFQNFILKNLKMAEDLC